MNVQTYTKREFTSGIQLQNYTKRLISNETRRGQLLKLHNHLKHHVIQSTYNSDKTDSLIYHQVILYSMDEKKDIVVIKVEREIRKRLKAAKRGGDTYNDVITKMFAKLEGDDKRQ